MEISLKQKLKSDYIFAWILALVYFIPNINYYLSFISQAMGGGGTTVVLYICIYLVVIYAYCRTITKGKITFVCLLMVAVLYGFTLTLWPQNEVYMFGDLWDAVYNPLYRILFLGLPLFFVSAFIEDYKYLYNLFCKFAIVNLGVALVAYIWLVIGNKQDFEYMTFSYNMLFSAALCFMEGRRRRSIVLLPASLLGIVAIIAMGSRGAMVCAALFVILSMFVFERKNGMQFFFLLISGLLVALILINFESVIKWLIDVLHEFGFASRSLQRLLNGTLLEDRGRDYINIALKNAISEEPVFGYGLFGDRYITELARGGSGATYAHNIFLEWLTQFGVVVGGIIIIVYVYNSIKCVFAKTDYMLKSIYICAFSAVFVRMLVSGSYLIEPGFYLLIGIIMMIKRDVRNSKYINVSNQVNNKGNNLT